MLPAPRLLVGKWRMWKSACPCGEVVLLVTLIGLQTNRTSQNAYAIVIVMRATTTILAPPLLRLLFKDENPDQRLLLRL